MYNFFSFFFSFFWRRLFFRPFPAQLCNATCSKHCQYAHERARVHACNLTHCSTHYRCGGSVDRHVCLAMCHGYARDCRQSSDLPQSLVEHCYSVLIHPPWHTAGSSAEAIASTAEGASKRERQSHLWTYTFIKKLTLFFWRKKS